MLTREADGMSCVTHTVKERDTLGVLICRVRGEYLEMPGMSLTLEQAARFWHLEHGQCRRVMTALVESGFLRTTTRGTFVRASI
jgi:hypothetical protein